MILRFFWLGEKFFTALSLSFFNTVYKFRIRRRWREEIFQKEFETKEVIAWEASHVNTAYE